MCTSVPQMPARCTRIRTSLMPMRGFSTSSSQRPGSFPLLTSAFMSKPYGSGARAPAGRAGSTGAAGRGGGREGQRWRVRRLLRARRARLGAAGGRSQQVSNDRRLVAVAADARADVAAGGAIEDLQVRDGRARAGEFGVQAFEQRTDYGGGRERGFEAQFALPVQPAEGGFRGGIAGVVDIEEAATGG